MSKESKDESIKREPCCKEQVKDITNSSNFISQNKTEFNVFSSTTIIPELCFFQNKCSINNIPFRLIFYESKTDLPVKYSSLLI